MQIDLYTKACLTVIAGSLLTLSMQQLIPDANADLEKELSQALLDEERRRRAVWVENEVLTVYCKNCN